LPVIEVDMLLAYLVTEDRHHSIASKYFSKAMSGEVTKPSITPFALQELELGIRAGKILPHGKLAKNEGDAGAFMNEICEALELYDIRIGSVECSSFAKAAEIREKYDLTYYDSLHAASALNYEDKTIVSTDPKYDVVKDLKRINPYKFAKGDEGTSSTSVT
jgi:predicted nucleic acid-binding protein